LKKKERHQWIQKIIFENKVSIQGANTLIVITHSEKDADTFKKRIEDWQTSI
jgi:arginine repressor